MRSLIVAAAVVAALCGMSGPSAARPIAPWCAVYSFGRGDVVSYCQYSSFEQCRPFVGAGSGGTCNINPAWPGSWQSAYYAGKPNRHAARRR